jgi:hypothetical protein
MTKNCRQCAQLFEITPADKEFYKKVEAPEPTLCPSCRQQRRLAFRNERYLHKSSCGLCKKEIVSTFPPSAPFPVFCNDCWWSDKWDALDYGRDFDFSRPFFPQFRELLMKVPKVALLQLTNENSEFNSYLGMSKNTYMSPGSYLLEDCYFVRKSQYSKDCLNSTFIDHCELVSYSLNSKNCYDSHNLINCRNCSDCAYLADSSGCKNCFMSSGIANKEFHIKNKPYPREEYEKRLKGMLERSPDDLMREFLEFNATIPKKYQNLINCENSSGDYLQNCKNAHDCYDSFEIQDSRYVTESVEVKDSMDLTMHDKNIELCYELSAGGESNYRLKYSFCSCASPNSEYLYSCFYLSDSFGCDSTHQKMNNCILNNKYSKDEYGKMKARIIEHMKKTGEYGEFFPAEMSLYPYNHTVAQDYFPLIAEVAAKSGYRWQKEDVAHYKTATAVLPADIGAVKDGIIKETLACEKCGKNYRVIKQELDLSRRMGVPLSKYCADCRQMELLALKNPRRLWDRACDNCKAPIKTSYSPERPEKVYCEKCYLNEVY